MSILACPEGTLLLNNVSEALRRQCELTASAAEPDAIAHETETAEALMAANRRAIDHISHCPICRTD